MLIVKNLTKKYNSSEHEVIALNNISFQVEDGEFVAIMGPSGSGKSTLLHMIGGVDQFDSGDIIVNDKHIALLNKNELASYRRKNIGLIYQFFNLIPILNVIENIMLPYKLGNSKDEHMDLDVLLNTLHLKDRELHYPSQLSGGQQQRVAIARAMFLYPTLILADEPTGNLDSTNRYKVIECLKQIHKEQKQTIIMVTHDLEIAQNASRIITIEDGCIVRDEALIHD